MNGPDCDWEGFGSYEPELQTRVRRYRRVVMLGDSMGGSAALLFSHLASLVIAFVPQIDLEADIHARREDFTPSRKQRFTQRLLANVKEAKGLIEVHRGRAAIDARHTALLEVPSEVSFQQHVAACRGEEGARAIEPRVLVTHDCDDHFVSTQLKKQGLLKAYIADRIRHHQRER